MSNKILNTYAAYAFDDLIRKQSSSGAIFSLIAEKILSYAICASEGRIRDDMTVFVLCLWENT